MKQQLKKNYNGLIDYILILSLILSIFIFIAMPFFYVFKESLVINGHLSFELFEDVFKNHLHLLKNSLSVGFYTTVLTAIAGITTALFSYMMPKKIKRLIFLILAVTMISPPFVTALSYINLFGRRGLVSYYLLGISKSPYGITGIVLMQSLSNFSLAALILIGFLNNLDRSQLDSARNLGAKTDRLIIDIILPFLFPAIKSVMLLTFLRSLSDFGTPAIIGGSFNVLATESYFAVIAQGNLGKASAINVLLLIPAIIIFILYQKSFKNISISSHGTASSEIEIKRQGILFYLISIIAVFFLLWISIQYSSIILSAFANILETRDHITSTVIRSMVYSLIAAGGGSVIGLLIAYYKQIRKIKIMQAVDFVATLPYIIPGTFFGLGYLLAFNSKPLMLTGTAAIVVLNILFKQLPFSTKIGNAAMEEINIDTLNSIRDLGGKRINEITDAVIPLSKNALGVSFINGFTTTMTTIGSIIFLVYPSQKVLTLVMFDVIQSGYYEIGSVIALLIIIICLIVNLIYFLVLKKK